MDDLDTAIVAQLQENARISLADLGRSVNLSPPALGVRLRRLEETGVITGYHARIHPPALGAKLLVFVEITLNQKSGPAFEQFGPSMWLAVVATVTWGVYQVLTRIVGQLDSTDVTRYTPPPWSWPTPTTPWAWC